MNSRTFVLSKSITLITNQRWTAFTHSSKYYESFHFLSKVSKFAGTSILIALSCFDNFLCPGRIDIPVVNCPWSCSTDFVRIRLWLLFHVWRMLFTDEVLLDPLSLELSDALLSMLFPLLHCTCWSFLSSLLSLLSESWFSDCCCDGVSFVVADSVVNYILVEVLGALQLRLPCVRRVCG